MYTNIGGQKRRSRARALARERIAPHRVCVSHVKTIGSIIRTKKMKTKQRTEKREKQT